MRLTSLLTLVMTLQMSASVWSQTTTMSVKLKNSTLQELFIQIEKNTNYRFFYNNDEVDVNQKISVDVEEKTVGKILTAAFEGLPYSFKEMENKLILIERTGVPSNFHGKNQQMKSVTGKVTDSSGATLPGVSVVVKGTTTGVITDMDGKYSLSNVPENATLLFSFVGMTTQELLVSNKSTINVVLTEETVSIDEVVAIGYGSQKKKELTGSVVGISAAELLHGSQTSPMGMIQGKVAGLNVIKPNSGDPNSDYIFQIRGASSLTGNITPLIIIDGISQGNLSIIPQDDIESIDILKDGSASAIYGTRGTNGVILVTTKKGRSGKMTAAYNGYISIASILNTPNIMNREQFIENGGEDRGFDTDWIDEITRTPFIQSHNIALTGGTSDFSYRTSISYKDNPGLAIKSGFEEIIGRFAASQKLLHNKVKLDVDVTYRRQDKQSISYNAFKHAQKYNPTAPVYDSTSKWGGYYEYDIQGYYNPVAYIKQRDDNNKSGVFQGSSRLGWDIVDGLKAEVFGTLYYSDNTNGSYSSRQIFNTSDFGRASRSYNNAIRKTIETTLNYAKSFKEHNLVILGGYSYEDNFRENFNANNSNFDSDIFSYYNLQAGSNLINRPTQDMMGSGTAQSKLISFFGRANYTYNNKYLLSASVRHEGSTRLGDNYKWGTFPAASLGWVISNEGFMSGVRAINTLKLRFGYGITGNMPSDDYLTIGMMGVVGRVYDNTSQTWISAYGPTQNVNKDIRWEKKGEWNLGLDLTAFNNRFNLTIDAYQRKVTDLIYNYKVPTPPFQYENIMANVGGSTSKGLEFMISGIPVQKGKFSWSSSINMSINSNRIDKFSNEFYKTDWIEMGNLTSDDLGGLNATPLIRLIPGGKVGSFYMPVFEGFTADGKWKFKDVNKDGKFTFDADREFVGNAQPDFIAGWNNEFKYGNFSLSFSLRAIVGNEVFDVTRLALENKSIAGTEKNMLGSVIGLPLNDAALVSDYYLEDGSFLKMDNITLSYDVPLTKLKSISKLGIYFTGQNMFTLTGYKGIDPEVNMVDIANMGIERTSYYPGVRLFVLGVNVSF